MAAVFQPGGQTSGSQSATYQNLSYLLRPAYLDAYQSTVAAHCPAYKMLKSDVDTIPTGGLNFNFNIVSRISGAAGFGGVISTGAYYGLTPAPMGRMVGSAQGTATFKSLMASAPLTTQNISLFQKNPNAPLDLLAVLDDDLLTSIGKSYERLLFGNTVSSVLSGGVAQSIDGTGILATLVTGVNQVAQGQPISIPISLGNGHPRQFYRGMQLLWGTYAQLSGSSQLPNQQGQLAGYTIASNGTVTLEVYPNFDGATLEVVLDNNPANNPVYLVCGDGASGVSFNWGVNTANPFNSMGNEPYGFRHMGQTSGALFGINPSTPATNNWIGVVDNGGLSGNATRQFTAISFQQFALKYAELNAVSQGGKMSPGADGAEVRPPKMAFMSEYFLPTFKAQVPGVAVLDPLAPEGGVSPDTIPYVIRGQRIDFMTSPRHPVDEITIIDTDAVKKPENLPLSPVTPYGGSPYTPQAPGFPTGLNRSFQAVEAIICTRRQGIGRYTNISVPNWTTAALND